MQKVQRCVRFLNVVETRSQSHTTRLSCYYDATKKKGKEKEKLTTFSTMQRHIWVAWGRSMFLISSSSCLDSSGDGKRKEGKKKQCAISNDCPVLSMLKRTRGMLFGFLTAAPVDCCRPAALLVCLFTDKLLDPYSIVRPQITSPEGLI